MTVDSDYTIAIIATLSDWLKNRSDAIFSTNEKQTQTNCTLYARFFPRFEQLSQAIAERSDWFISLFAPVVIGRSFITFITYVLLIITLVSVFRQSFENRFNSIKEWKRKDKLLLSS